MRISHFLFGLLCFVAAGHVAAQQAVDAYRTGYRVEVLIQEKARLEEARCRLHVALGAVERPDRLLDQAAAMKIPLVEPAPAASERGGFPEER